jgi:hypothetical protein
LFCLLIKSVGRGGSSVYRIAIPSLFSRAGVGLPSRIMPCFSLLLSDVVPQVGVYVPFEIGDFVSEGSEFFLQRDTSVAGERPVVSRPGGLDRGAAREPVGEMPDRIA